MNITPAPTEEQAAIAHVKRFAGVVKRDDKLPGDPVVEVNVTFGYPLGVADLRPLATFRELRTLKVEIDRLTPAMLAELRSFKSVKSLSLHISDCSGLDPKTLTQLDALEELSLEGEIITDDVLKRVVDLASDSAASTEARGAGWQP